MVATNTPFRSWPWPAPWRPRSCEAGTSLGTSCTPPGSTPACRKPR